MIDARFIIAAGAAAVCVAVGFGAGWSLRGNEVAELKAEHFNLIEQINRESNEAYSALADQLADREKRLAEALSARDSALALASAARADASRLRVLADNRSAAIRALPAATGASCDRDRERLARCVSLLGEGAELVGEGSGLSLRLAGDNAVAGVK